MDGETLPTKFIIETTDVSDMELYSHAVGYSLAIFDLDNKLREILKWREGLGEKEYALVEEIREALYEARQKYHLPME